MPRIFDNIERSLLPTLKETLRLSDRADFCVGYFNLRGWRQLGSCVEDWSGGEGHCCRLLVGMHRHPREELQAAMGLAGADHGLDNQAAIRLRKQLAQEFRDQLTLGAPTDEDEAGLRRLAAQIRAKKVVVKLFLSYPLHAKLYLLFRPDPVAPIVGYLGSSNLTMAGLSGQGELNIDATDADACEKLATWFEARWKDRWCIDISDELVKIIEESWAREEPIPPHQIYVKMAYHLSQEARAGLSEFTIPADFGDRLFEFQIAAVKIAAHHLNKRGGVLIGDVVGLGKTLMATALARIFQDDQSLETLIICPKNLVKMWEDYRDKYRLIGRVMPITRAHRDLVSLRRYRLVVLDESHNLRNREGRRYRAIQEYLRENESRCILLSATPYNKSYLDLSSQLRLFVPEDRDLGTRPERLLKELGETEFIRRHQCAVRSLAAFEKSEYPDDWRELMRLYMVRRTRGFIQENYATLDEETGRKYLTFEDGSRSYFPVRVPRTKQFDIDDRDPLDQYARLYAPDVVDTINGLSLPRYGLGNYEASPHQLQPTPEEARVLHDLGRAGKRLMGFCRTGLFKRLESSGNAFLESLDRHLLRNYVFLHALENGLPVPVGTQDSALLDSRFTDVDADAQAGFFEEEEDGEAEDAGNGRDDAACFCSEDEYRRRAGQVYAEYTGRLKKRFKWLKPGLFTPDLAEDLRRDCGAIQRLLNQAGPWDPNRDAKLASLVELLTQKHPQQKVIIFTQFADTVRYLERQLRAAGVSRLAGVTGDSPDPTGMAWRFSPESNEKRQQVSRDDELRVLVATDVLSEGQNLQDCAVVVNYDLPWAIIRLIQRAGRVDRIGQKAERILCYSFLPADGVERIISLRARVRRRLHENAEVVGTDEAFFEDDDSEEVIRDLYSEKSGILDGDGEGEVDLASYAYQIWRNAITADPSLQRTIQEMPPVVYSTRPHRVRTGAPEGVLVYMRTGEGNDSLAWVDRDGRSVTESQFEILRAAECLPETPSLPKLPDHHRLVRQGVEAMVEEERSIGGALGRPSGARFKTYQKLKRHAESVQGTIFDIPELRRALEEIYRTPLRPTAVDTLNRQLRSGISDEALAELVMQLRSEDRLCVAQQDGELLEPKIICSLGLSAGEDRR